MDGSVFLVFVFLWAVSAGVAAIIASDRGRSGLGFAAVTFFFLGPLGPGFALIAQHGDIEKSQLQAARATANPTTATAGPNPAKHPRAVEFLKRDGQP